MAGRQAGPIAQAGATLGIAGLPFLGRVRNAVPTRARQTGATAIPRTGRLARLLDTFQILPGALTAVARLGAALSPVPAAAALRAAGAGPLADAGAAVAVLLAAVVRPAAIAAGPRDGDVTPTAPFAGLGRLGQTQQTE